jgi:hypothetical protein
MRVCTTQLAIVRPAGTDVAAPWSKRLWGKVACLAGAHDWSDWEVRDPDRPGEQVRMSATLEVDADATGEYGAAGLWS